MYHYNRSIYILIVLFISGCHITNNIQTKDEFDNASEGSISILTKDTTKYFLEQPTLIDSIIRGTGRMEKNNISNDFNGEIRLSDVLYIQSENTSFWGTVAAASAIGFLGLTARAILDDESEGVNAKVNYPYHAPGPSCPFIYSKTGSEYTLEGEAIPFSLCKKLETETTNSLSHLTSGNNEINLRISNERPETHYINSVRLLKYNYETGYKLLADENNVVWPEANEIAPLRAEDINKRNILPEIAESDSHYWESDLSTALPAQDFTDKLIITFPKEKTGSSAALIIQAINTGISNVIFRKMYDLLGDEILDFMNEAENNPEVLSTLQKWFKEVSLNAYLWNGNEWIYEGKIYAEATCVPFERIVRLDLKDIQTDNLTIKLEFMTDVWKIDKAAISFTDAGPLQPVEIPLVSADFSGREINNKISAADGKYQVLMPGDKIELNYYDNEPGEESRYFLNVTGYLYEWYVKDPGADPGFLAVIPEGISRLELFRTLISNKNLLLPPVYAEWEKVR